MKNLRFIKTVAIIGALVLMVLTVLPGCNFIGKADNNKNGDTVVTDTNGNQLCCPICSATDITGPDAEGKYTCNACGAVWDYNEKTVEVVDENGNVVKQLDANSGYVDRTSGGNYSSVGGNTSGGNTSGGNTSGGNTSGGNTSGGNTSGGNTSGGNTSGGNTSGGNTSGGKTSGGNTSGGNTSGGNTSGGKTSGGNTSGGNTQSQGIDTQKIQKVLKDLDDSIEIVYDEETQSYTAKSKDGTDTGLFGYKYSTKDKIFYTAEDSWQRNFGFAEVYDKAAAIGFMTYNTFRVYYTYEDYDWMIQFWKGQYGYAFIGSEIGVYTRPAGSTNGTFYDCADDAHKFYMTMDVYRQDPDNNNKYTHLFTRSRSKTWWCTGFVPGTLGFAQANVPDENGTATLKVDSKIEFYTPEMAQAFMNGLSKVTVLENNAALSGTNRPINFIKCANEAEYAACSSSAKYCLCEDGTSVRVCYR